MGASLVNLHTTDDPDQRLLNSTNQVKAYIRRKIKMTCDGIGLQDAHKVPTASEWVLEGTKLISGQAFINEIQVRTGTLFSREGAARGRNISNQCSRGCSQPETLNHVLQNCYASDKLRIIRHDRLVEYIHRGAQQRKFSLHMEPEFSLPVGKLKPDLVLYKDDRAIVVDAQVINNQYPLEKASQEKIKKYTPLIKHQLKDTKATILSFTINWRGVICKSSADSLVKKGVIAKRDLKILAVRTLEGRVARHRVHQKMMTSKRVKKGEG
ncbi:hypothetical protein JTE90_015723 [Oedothorax gibbosus]|uniref:Reverse transcriptase n=1 Tax=Oedothorax gibbosus TaxID=931172 RepID=A0AAV6TZX2_9ARAC|nr:hypothetical protein JTE90_015723 [Oedothorax gibbosus]